MKLAIPPSIEDQQIPIIERVKQILATPVVPKVPQFEAEIDLVEKASVKGGTL